VSRLLYSTGKGPEPSQLNHQLHNEVQCYVAQNTHGTEQPAASQNTEVQRHSYKAAY
jgi:hypothetical protein